MPADPQAHGRAAFEAWFRQHYADVARFCARRCDDEAEAEDAASETFAIAWRSRERVPEGDAARPWLFGIARGVLANQQRSSVRRRRLFDRLRSTGVPVLASCEEPGELANLAAAFARLPARQRELLAMTAWDGLSVAEIAAVLGVPAPVVSRRLHRARRRLASLLDAPCEPGAQAPAPVPVTRP